jgi:hypothetical protein
MSGLEDNVDELKHSDNVKKKISMNETDKTYRTPLKNQTHESWA